MNRQITCLLATFLCLGTQFAQAANVVLAGEPAYAIAKSKITIIQQKIQNLSPTNNSGALRLQVWAAPTVYAGGPANGYVIGSIKLAALRGGKSLSVSNTVAYKAPPNGSYYRTITLEEASGGKWVVRNYYNVPGTADFSTNANLVLNGSVVSWSILGSTLRIGVDKISNLATAGTSKPLRLELWATTSNYRGSELIDDQTGYLIGAAPVSRIAGGYSLAKVNKSTRHLPPPDGFFYTSILLAEWTGTNWAHRYYQPFVGSSYFGGPGTNATKLDMLAPVSWSQVGKNAKMRTERIINRRAGNTSGPLKLQLWASASAYNGGTFDGYVLASASAGKVSGGANLNKVTKIGKLYAPPDGEYFTTLALVEGSPAGDLVQDFIPFGSTITLTSKTLAGLSATGVAATNNNIDMSGRTTYSLSTTNANLTVAKIANNRRDISGNLRLNLYALAAPYTQGPIYGALIAERQLGRLAVGAAYLEVSGNVPYTKPAAGRYYILLALEEWQNDKYVVVDSVPFARPITVR